MKYIKEFREKFSNKDVFSTRDVKLFLKGRKANPTYYSLFLNNLLTKGELHRLMIGKYSFRKEIDFLEKTINPSYHGLQDALSLYQLWQQQTIPILITPRKVRTGERMIGGSKTIVRRITRKMFFGFESKKFLDSWITISDLEKTLIDFVYYNEPLNKETLKELLKKINKEKLREYLKKTNKTTAKKVESLF